ncbi:MAG TPA: hypothetical protein VHZ52_09965, partial [Acidobacteriaceae bacterium]|nr:hypothetical protein [Acidobacteriaceae bacterium]
VILSAAKDLLILVSISARVDEGGPGLDFETWDCGIGGTAAPALSLSEDFVTGALIGWVPHVSLLRHGKWSNTRGLDTETRTQSPRRISSRNQPQGIRNGVQSGV